MSEGKKYIVHGVKAECNEGTMQNYINTDTGHGVLYQGQPLLNANDHMPKVNLTHFGDCNSKKIYEKAKEQVDEKYKAEEGDGFFSKAGKFIAKTASKTVLDVKETFGIHKCELDTPIPWMFCNSEHMIDGAPALTEDSQCPCRYGGIIRIVKESGDSDISGQDDHVEIEKTETVAVAAALLNAEVQQSGELGESIPALKGKANNPASSAAGIGKAMYDRIKDEKKKNDPLELYVNEETFKAINSNWNSASLKKKYGNNFFENLRELMRLYEITDKTSILMFIATIGTESWYGLYATEKYNDGYFNSKPYTKNTRGAGLMQLTGWVQKEFLQYLRSQVDDNSDKAKELDPYIKAFSENEKGTVCDCEKNTAEYIAKNYALESAVWYWAVCKSQLVVNGTNVTINEYIENFNGKKCNMDNVFLAVQYGVNGFQLSKENTVAIGKSKKSVINGNQAKINGQTGPLPRNWDSRYKDWKKAKKFLKGKKKNA